MSKTSMTATHPQMRPDQAMSMIEALCINPMEQGRMPIPVMIWGQPGVGKSSIIKQLGEKHNRPVIDIRLLLKDPTDLAGLPYFDVNQGELKVANPVGFPDEKNPEHAHLLNAIIILDELSSAPKAVQSAALQLILDRKVGDYTLPKDVIMIAAGNRSEDGNVFEEMPTPLRNRFAHIDLVADFKQWKKWAEESDIHPIVLGFLESSGGADFNNFDAKTLMGRYAFATPRSWERVSDALWAITDRETLRVTNERLVQTLVGSLVGTDVATKLNSFFTTFGELPSPTDILEGKVKSFDYEKMEAKKRQSARYATILGLTHVMKERFERAKGDDKALESFDKVECTNFIKFMTTSMATAEEFMAIAGERVIRDKIPIFKKPEFREFIKHIHGVLNQI